MARLCDLPMEVVEEIVLRLSPESLKLFKCISKKWYAYIDGLMKDQEFVAKHLHYMKDKMFSALEMRFQNLMVAGPPGEQGGSVEEGTYLLTLANDNRDSLDYIPNVREELKTFTDPTRVDKIEVCHCNGIICLSKICERENFFLVNPSLKEIKIVPFSSCLAGKYDIWGLGFGYDPRGNDYKVVVIWSHMEDIEGLCTAQVYNLSTNSWKEIQFDERILDFAVDYKAVYCNGVCYWYYWNDELTITSFDFGDEVFCNIPVPDNADSEAKDWEELADWTKIGVWKESLVLFYYVGEAPTAIEMWVMDSYASGDSDSDNDVEDSHFWTKYLTIGPLLGITRPLEIWGKDHLVMETEGGEIISYSLSTQKLGDCSVYLKRFKSHGLVFYVKSLVSLVKRVGRVAQP